MQFFIILVISGFFAGALGGLLGIGGGIVIMPILRLFVGMSPALAAGTCIIAVFFTTLGGSFRHYKLGNVNFSSLMPVILAGVVMTALFSLIFLLFTERQRWLDLGMGLTFSLVSLRMVLEGIKQFTKIEMERTGTNKIEGSLLGKIVIGGGAGVLPGFLGIGTGAILVPVFVFVLNAPMKLAIGSSLTCFCANAFVSSAFKLFQGFTVPQIAIPLCIGTLIGSNVGAILNKRFPSGVLKIIFGLLFLYVSFKYILLFLGATL